MVATVGTWSLDPEFPVEQRGVRRSLVTPAAAGAVQRGDVQKSVGVDSVLPITRVFGLRFAMATITERDTYLADWERTARGALALLFTPPGGSAIPVRLVGAPKITRTSPTRYAFSVTLEEVTNG